MKRLIISLLIALIVITSRPALTASTDNDTSQYRSLPAVASQIHALALKLRAPNTEQAARQRCRGECIVPPLSEATMKEFNTTHHSFNILKDQAILELPLGEQDLWNTTADALQIAKYYLKEALGRTQGHTYDKLTYRYRNMHMTTQRAYAKEVQDAHARLSAASASLKRLHLEQQSTRGEGHTSSERSK